MNWLCFDNKTTIKFSLTILLYLSFIQFVQASSTDSSFNQLLSQIDSLNQQQSVVDTNLLSSKSKPQKNTKVKDIRPRFFKDSTRTSAKDAALLGAMMPGLGQIYNRKYWKLPIVYGGIAGSMYWLISEAKRTKEFNQYLVMSAKQQTLPTKVAHYSTAQIESMRNTYRRNVQIASFVTVMVWGFTIIDAAVDAHIRPFDVSDNLSMQIKPSVKHLFNDNYLALSINLNLK